MQAGREEPGLDGRTVVYCVVPRDLAAKLHEPLRRHFRDDPGVEVVVQRRTLERRTRPERRSAQQPRPAERRSVHNAEGRRVADRRAALVPIAPPPLPRRAARHAPRLTFFERVEPSSQAHEDAQTARLVIRFQAGEQDIFGDLYLRYFDRVYAYVLVALRDQHEAEDATQQVFLRALQALPRYERRSSPFRAWLFRVARNLVIDKLERLGRINVVEPAELRRQYEDEPAEEADLKALDWISDRELMIFIDRLPLAQRQVLVMRYVLSLTTAEIAAALDRTPGDVRAMQSRALRFLRKRLEVLGREPKRPLPRARLRRSLRPAHVLRARRSVLG